LISKQNSGIPSGVLPMTMLDHLVSSGVAALIVSMCILLHYEALNGLERLSRVLSRHRWIVLITMFGLILSHIAQMWVFALGYYSAEHWLDLGSILGRDGGTARWLDYVYYSAVVFTTVGFGDMIPVDGLRMLTMSEALAGFSLISWSASFTFLQMQRVWRQRPDE
jgi:hypothetical protein